MSSDKQPVDAKNCLIIIPCYNEELRLNGEEFHEFCKQHPHIHFLFVNDGSTDNTRSMLEDLTSRHVSLSLLDLEVNVGKAEAVRQGFVQALKSDVPFIGFWDADLATPLNEITAMLEHLGGPTQLVFGCRHLRMGTSIQRKMSRHYFGRIFATIVSTMLGLPLYDTQCGAKIMQRSVAKVLFEKPFVSPWFFDVEMVFRYKAIYGQQAHGLIESTLASWTDVDGSKLKFTDFLRTPLELLKIYLHYK